MCGKLHLQRHTLNPLLPTPSNKTPKLPIFL